ncbi:MAG: carbohydrate binding domain-containing protein [Oscillospiraceae bacterium]|nr:carbohydrate binding domain-containing protein [Oscillospiraceae bacterium]
MKKMISLLLGVSLLVTMLLGSAVPCMAVDEVSSTYYDFSGLTELPGYVVAGKHATLGDGIQLETENSSNSSDTNSIYLRCWSAESRVDFGGFFNNFDFSANIGKTYKISVMAKISSDSKSTDPTIALSSEGSAYLALVGSDFAVNNKGVTQKYHETLYVDNGNKTTLSNSEWTEVSMLYTVGQTTKNPMYIGVRADSKVSSKTQFAMYIDEVKIEPVNAEKKNSFYDSMTYNSLPDFIAGNKNNKTLVINSKNNASGENGSCIESNYWDAYVYAYYKGAFDELNLEKGQKYRISYMAKTTENNTLMCATICSSVCDAKQNYTAIASGNNFAVNSTQWTKVFADFTIEDTLPYAIRFANNSNVGIVYIDDLRITNITDIEEPYLASNVVLSDGSNTVTDLSGLEKVNAETSLTGKIEDEINVTVIYAVYDGNDLKSIETSRINVGNTEKKDTKELDLKDLNNPHIKVMFWNDLQVLIPFLPSFYK